MPLGDLTKQLAAEALRSATTPKPAPPAPPETAGAVILAQLQAMQKACKEDEELIVTCAAAGESVRVLECFFPSWKVAVLTGTNSERAVTRILAPVETLQLACHVGKVATGGKPVRLTFVAPRG